ncbi:MAG TPA: retropepsin-like aspartic protease [Ideonella sp.]|uniref:retropepsin-like aspartic protease family protein n=1 Tax=Ideonella sp. TaxID=1929293 RepID=UPI002E3382B0|nr:retropepsin-like aspartic protease [Ideonella sp.]HEX5686260.1 retropepsin-like aspartic protease [Ideonella sp.]
MPHLPRRRLALSLSALVLAPWLVAPARAQSVLLSGTLGSSKALLVIDGQMRTVAIGQTVGGVTLRSIGTDEAVVLIGGKPFSVRLGASPVSLGGGGSGGGGSAIVLPAGPGGHFMANGSINGKSANFMVDTGATTIAMGMAEAQRLGLRYDGGRRGMASTAGGSVPMYEVNLNSVRIGDVEVYNLSAGVVQADMPYILLGNNFLSRFNMRRDGDTMRLEKKP